MALMMIMVCDMLPDRSRSPPHLGISSSSRTGVKQRPHAQLVSQPLEVHARQSLGQDIGGVIPRSNLRDGDVASVDQFSSVVILYPNVFGV